MSKVTQQPHMLLKAIFLGDSGVGKTSLITREAQNTFRTQFIATIGVDFRIKTYTIGKMQVKVQYWDTAGQQRFRSIQRPYYKNAQIIILCFDLSSRSSFENLKYWKGQLDQYPQDHRQIFLIGCKSDLDAQVATDEAMVFALNANMIYLQTSAKTGDGINDAFNKIVLIGSQMQMERQIIKVQRDGMAVKNESFPDKKRCC